MSILAEIFAHKRLEIEQARRARPLAEVQAQAASAAPALDFAGALDGRNLSHPGAGYSATLLSPSGGERRDNSPMSPLPGAVPGARGGAGGGEGRQVTLIAEVKCASPSRGLLSPDFDPLKLAATYAANGAAAISVLTDERYFKGHLDYLRQIRQAQAIPLLRKDFICDPYQVYEARAAGADALLLIAAELDLSQLADLQALTHSLGMAALVEVHNLPELETALQSGARLIGINNRNLHTFQVSLETSQELRPLIPAEICVVAESGIHSAADVARLAAINIQAVLVGEALVTAADTAAKVRELSGFAPGGEAA